MLSIIVCLKNKVLSKPYVDNIATTVGVVYEVITIDNSDNRYSIFTAYNAGFAKSNYPYLCFVHEDVLFHTQNWGEKVIAHLQTSDTGLIGLAGSDLVTRVPAAFIPAMCFSINIIQSDRSSKEPTKSLREPHGFDQSKRNVILLDGVFLCMRRELMEKNKFDEQLNGFHCYDYDISIQSVLAGYSNYVVYDILLEHFSKGKTDGNYYRNLIAIFKKWEKYLPMIGKSITSEQHLEIINIEKKNLLKLPKKLARKGFNSSEIKKEIAYFALRIEYPKAIRNLTVRLFFIRLFNCPKYLFK